MAMLLKEISVGSAYGTWYLCLYEDNVTQNIAGNTSTISLRLTMRCSMAGASISFDSRDAWINTTHFTPTYTQTAAEHDIGTTTATIGHNADGSASYSVGFGITTSYIVGGSSTAGRTLPTIPRASSIGNVSGNMLGSAITINISRASSSFTHTVKYQFGSIVREYTGQAASCSFTPPVSDSAQTPNLDYGTATITLITYNGGTQIGEAKSQSVKLNVPVSVIPTFTALSIVRVDNGVPATWGVYVQGKSKATLSITGAAGIYGSTIKSFSISGGGFSTTASSFTTGILTGKGKISFTANIVDSRGRSATKTVEIDVVENYLPSLTLKAERSNATGTTTNNGTCIKITPIYSFAPAGKNVINSMTFAIAGTSYKKTTADSGASFVLGNNDIAISKSYEVTGIITDMLGQSSGTIRVLVSSSAVPFNIRNDGSGAAFGKYAESANRLDSAWPIFMGGKSLIDLFMPIGSVITNASASFNPNTLYSGTTWIRIKGRVIVGIDEGDSDFSTTGKTGGAKIFNNSHTHTVAAHSHALGSTGYAKISTDRTAVRYDYISIPAWTARWQVTGSSSGGETVALTEAVALGGSTSASSVFNTGGNGLSSQSILQPYISKYVWERTA